MKNTTRALLLIPILISGCATKQVVNSEYGTLETGDDRYIADVEECVGLYAESQADSPEEVAEIQKGRAERTKAFQGLVGITMMGKTLNPGSDVAQQLDACMEEKKWSEW